MPLFTYILFGLQLESLKICWKALVIVIPFFSFKETTYTYLLKVSMTHHTNQRLLSYPLINYISTRSASQILSLKDEYTFCFPSFLINWLCYSSADCCFEKNLILLLIADLSRVAEVSDLDV